jgi:hypothetical protein
MATRLAVLKGSVDNCEKSRPYLPAFPRGRTTGKIFELPSLLAPVKGSTFAPGPDSKFAALEDLRSGDKETERTYGAVDVSSFGIYRDAPVYGSIYCSLAVPI